MSNSITDFLAAILSAKYGEQVRGAIHDAIELCYQDGKAGVNDLEARHLIEQVIGVNEMQDAGIETLTARVEALEQGGEGESAGTTTTTVPTFIVDSGIVNFSNVGANKSATEAVTFSKTFTEAPVVVCIKAFRNAANTFYSQVTAQPILSSITTTGCTLAVGNRYTQAVSPSVLWIAFQPTEIEINTEIIVPSGDGMTEAEVRELLAPISAALNGIKTGYDGTVYDTPGEAVREQINDLHVLIGDTPGTAIQASAVAYNNSNVAAELTNVNGRLRELASSKNLFDINGSYHFVNGDGSASRDRYVTVSNGTFICTNSVGDTGQVIAVSDNESAVLEAGTYTISARITLNESVTDTHARMASLRLGFAQSVDSAVPMTTERGGNTAVGTDALTGWVKGTFTLTEAEHLAFEIAINRADQGNSNLPYVVDMIQIEKGSAVTEYSTDFESVEETARRIVEEYEEGESDSDVFEVSLTANDVVNGYIGASGVFKTSNSWRASDYIYFKSVKTELLVTCTVYGNGGLAFYDKDKACIRYINGSNASEYDITTALQPRERTIAIPEGSEYIRISMYYDGSKPVEGNLIVKGNVTVADIIGTIGNVSERVTDNENTISQNRVDFDEYVHGVNKTFAVETADAYSYFPVLLLKGKSYTFTNNTSKGVALKIRKGIDGETYDINEAVRIGQSYPFIVPEDGYTYIGGYFNGAGTFAIVSDFNGIEGDNKYMSLLKWHDGKVYMGINGMPYGTGLNIPNVSDAFRDGYTVLFADDFDGEELDTTNWGTEIGYSRNNEPQAYQAQNVELKNSNAVITAKREHVQYPKNGVLVDFYWTSASIYYHSNLDFDIVESKILMPKIPGAWPAFWGTGRIGTYPDCGEIDIVEGGGTDRISSGAWYTDANGVQKRTADALATNFNVDGYHIYTLIRENGFLRFLVDGIELSSVEITSEMSEFNNPFGWILNLALSPDTSKIPAEVNEYKMYIDWFRMYKKAE